MTDKVAHKKLPKSVEDDNILHVTENVDKKGIFYIIRKLPEVLQEKFAEFYVKKNEWWCFEKSELKSLKKRVKKKGFKVKIARMAQAMMSLDEALTNFTEVEIPRLRSKIKPFDELLNGGFAKGSTSTFGGDPGVGKSTLATQL